MSFCDTLIKNGEVPAKGDLALRGRREERGPQRGGGRGSRTEEAPAWEGGTRTKEAPAWGWGTENKGGSGVGRRQELRGSQQRG